MYLREIHKEIIEISRGMAIVLLCKDGKRMVIHKNRSIATSKQKMWIMFLSKLVANFVHTDFIKSMDNKLLQIPVNSLCCNATFCALYYYY